MERLIDNLTGLISGVELNLEMENLIAQSHEFTFITMDIGHMLPLNRDFGHEAGDEVFRMTEVNQQILFSMPKMQ